MINTDLKNLYRWFSGFSESFISNATERLAEKMGRIEAGEAVSIDMPDAVAITANWHRLSREVFTVGRDVSEFVDSCVVDDIPESWPRLMTKPFWAKSPDRSVLFGDVFGVEFSPFGSLCLMRILRADGPHDVWVSGIARDAFEKYQGDADSVVRRSFLWAITLAITIEAAASPVVENRTYCNSSRNKFVDMGSADASQVVNRYIKISDDYKERVRNLNSSVGHTLNTDGLTLSPAIVRPHMRYQACGANKEDRKWVYIAPYVSSRWKSGAFVNTKVTL